MTKLAYLKTASILKSVVSDVASCIFRGYPVAKIVQ